jgi:hypothetical protein
VLHLADDGIDPASLKAESRPFGIRPRSLRRPRRGAPTVPADQQSDEQPDQRGESIAVA